MVDLWGERLYLADFGRLTPAVWDKVRVGPAIRLQAQDCSHLWEHQVNQQRAESVDYCLDNADEYHGTVSILIVALQWNVSLRQIAARSVADSLHCRSSDVVLGHYLLDWEAVIHFFL